MHDSRLWIGFFINRRKYLVRNPILDTLY